MTAKQTQLLNRIARCELAAETLFNQAQLLRDEVRDMRTTLEESLSEPAAAAPSTPTAAQVIEEVRRPDQSGPVKKRRHLSPEVKANRIASLVAARAELAKKRAEAKNQPTDSKEDVQRSSSEARRMSA